MSALNFVAGSTCYKNSNYVRVGHGSSIYNDAVWAFQLGDGSMASINSVRINFQWNNADAGEGWSSGRQYVFGLSTNGGDARIAHNDPNCVGYAYKNISGSYGSDSVDITGLSLAPGVTYYLRCNLNGATLSTLKNFGKSAQSISLLSYTSGTPPTQGNSRPYWSGGTCALNVPSVFSEAIGAINVSWAGAYDADGDVLWYDVVRVTSNHGTKLIYHGTDNMCSDSSFTYDDAQVEAGQSVYYNVTVQDEHGLLAQTVIQSPVVTRNSMSQASLSFRLEHQIGFDTGEFLCHRSDPTNLLPESSFTYNLTCDKVTVYNPTVDIRNTGNPSSILIWRTGDPVPTTPYVIFTELVVALRNTNYKGPLTFTLATTNYCGTTKSSVGYINVDITVEPLWVTPNFQYSGEYTINNHLYYLPDVRPVTLSWNAAIERLEGGAVSYDVECKLPTDSEWKRIGWEITSTSTSLNIPSTDFKTMYNVRVIAKVSYGKSTISDASNISIDKYLRPIIGLKSKKRNTTSVVVNLNITPRTTILSSDYSIASLSFLKCDGSTYVSLPTSSWTPTFEYGVTPYTDATFTKLTSYTMICRFNDSLGAVFGGSYANVLTLSIPITAYVPMFSIRKKGIGINSINDGTGSFILKVKGKVNSIADDNNESGFYENGSKCVTAAETGNASGVIPVSNGTKCVNLNADMVDGIEASAIMQNYYLSSATDFNTVVNSGAYRFNFGCTNANGVSYGQLLVIHGAGDTITQIMSDLWSGGIWWRSGNPPQVGGGGSWGAWRAFYHSGNIGNICKNVSGAVNHTCTASGWYRYDVSFGVTYTAQPLVSVMGTTQFSIENIQLVSLSTTGMSFQIYEGAVGFNFGAWWMAVGNIAL